MGQFDDPLGSLLIGQFLNLTLYTLELVAAYFYYTEHAHGDVWGLKLLVAAQVTLDTVGTMSNSACLYLYLITHLGDMVFLSRQNWTFPLVAISTGASALCCQSYLISRAYRISKKFWVLVLLSLVALTACGGSVWVGTTLITFPSYEDRFRAQRPVSIWLIVSAAADTLIAGVLIFHLAAFIKRDFRDTNSLLVRLIRNAMLTGSVTTVVAMAAFVVYMINPSSNVEAGMVFTLGRLYGLTLLYNLNTRRSSASDGRRSSFNQGRVLSMSKAGRAPPMVGSAGAGSGIHVQSTAIVQFEEVEDYGSRKSKPALLLP